MTPKTFISVILPLKLEWEPCYYLPDDICTSHIEKSDCSGVVEKMGDIMVGDRVKVMFASKEYSGVISAIGISPETDPTKIKPIICVERTLERILPEEIELWRKVAEYYMCTIGEVYKAAYPIGKINLEEAHAEAMVKAQERKVKILNSMNAKAERIRARIQKKEEMIVRAKEGTKAKARYKEELERIKHELETAENAIDNLLATSETCVDRACNVHIELSSAQKSAYDNIRKAFDKGKPVLLHGITGSGKTEIYIKLAHETLSKGRNVLYLVPEIALSRQLEDRLQEHFGERLLTYHSGETATTRRNTAEAIRSLRTQTVTSSYDVHDDNGNYIVLGTRSSLFLPHHNLGLIVVDEEHDSSYKQDSPAPRYNGRDTALIASVLHKSHIIMGSATPSLEELYNCECGKHVMVGLNERYHGAEEAEIEIIDTIAERRKRGMHGSFSRKLIDHIKETLSEGGQVMILRSRRAWAPAMQCEECGNIPKCPHCNVSLSYHKTGSMICHYCGYKTEYTGRCIKCNNTLKSLGAGTQKIEEEAAAIFPKARIARLDSDTAKNKSFEKKTIKAFSKGEIDILIGTQMVAKGFDFSKLRLVAVIAADSMLGMQDFRADEKAVQLLEQFKGRCGRRGTKGMFIIQTSQPEHPIYQHITGKENTPFNTSLLEERKTFGFPPYTRIIEITVRDSYEDRAERIARKLADMLRDGFRRTGRAVRPTDKDISAPTNQIGIIHPVMSDIVTGPYSPVVDKVADQFIRAIRICLPKDKNLKAGKLLIINIIQKLEKESRYTGHITVNVDPS